MRLKDNGEMRGLLGRKIGMTRYFDESGNSIPATLIEAGPCTVVQIKNIDKDGYNAVQLGFLKQKEKRVTKPLLGHFRRANAVPHRILREFRDFDLDIKVGEQIGVDLFSEGDIVNITGYSKGRGFAGVVKRHGFKGGVKSHGQSDRHRAPGSIGQSANPKRVFKGLRMAGRMGNERVTIKNLEILKIFKDKNLILVKGAVPGHRNSIVEIHC